MSYNFSNRDYSRSSRIKIQYYNSIFNFRSLLYTIYYFANCFIAPDYTSIIFTLPFAIIIVMMISRIKSQFVQYYDIFFLIIYLLFIISPLQYYNKGFFDEEGPTKFIRFSLYELVTAQLIGIIFVVTFYLAGGVFSKFKARTQARNISTQSTLYIAVIGLSCFMIYIPTTGGLDNIITTRSERVLEDVGFFSGFLLSGLVISTLLCLTKWKSLTKRPLAISILCFCLLTATFIAQNPFATSRNGLVQTWLPIVLIILSGRLRASFFYAAAMFGLLILMPVLNGIGRGKESISEAFSSLEFSVFRIPFSDFFEILAYGVRYFDGISVFFGEKILGLIFFFIPRSIWQGKATLPGLDVGGQLLNLKLQARIIFLFLSGAMPMQISGCLVRSLLALSRPVCSF